MGRKIFITYKYGDEDVNNINDGDKCTVRNYVDEIETVLGGSDHIYKGESDGEDLSELSEDTIWEKLKTRIYDSSLTIIMISKNMRDTSKADKDQWIPREISYSLKEVSRQNKNGDAVTSKTNAVLAIVVPDQNNSCTYYFENKNCCSDGCLRYYRNNLFNIIKNNMFNLKNGDKKVCADGSTIHYGEHSYITSVSWDDFIKDMDKYIDKAYELQDNIDNYEITKEV